MKSVIEIRKELSENKERTFTEAEVTKSLLYILDNHYRAASAVMEIAEKLKLKEIKL